MNRMKMMGLVVAILLSANRVTFSQTPKDARDASIAKELESHLHNKMYVQVEAWNRGDIAEFMKPYWNDERLTFSSGGQTQRGWQRTFQQYKAKYPDRATMGTLQFSDLESQELGADSVLTLGVWKLEREQPIGGNFTLIWKRIDGNWVIIHDHSSARIP